LNQPLILSNGIPLRISIGDRDEFVLNMGRRASPEIHQFLNNLNIHFLIKAGFSNYANICRILVIFYTTILFLYF